MINVPMKFHDPSPKHSLVIIRKPPGGWTDGPTDMSKAIYPLFFKGGHNKNTRLVKEKTAVHYRVSAVGIRAEPP
ncbi:hypothetical protein DPMN_079694 [Dreissena polymorpha]|uniref:Uncharacterized protein n=1 Tax=Dreissena polymorpha TaxID=45954 RepID=A0A9D3YT17_DREPO|nr:hypothetical protein DPMN_079694 [Dreissena polymorpha]